MAYNGPRIYRAKFSSKAAKPICSEVGVCTSHPRWLILTLLTRCNTAPEFPSFFGITYANMVHVTDMRVLLEQDANHTNFQTVGFYSPVSPEPFYAGLGLFQLALDEWLPCFQSQSNRSTTG